MLNTLISLGGSAPTQYDVAVQSLHYEAALLHLVIAATGFPWHQVDQFYRWFDIPSVYLFHQLLYGKIQLRQFRHLLIL